NPVIGPDGTVYLGTADGILRSYRPDGTASWTRQINKEHGGFYGSPVVGRDGSIYLVSSIPSMQSPNRVNESFVHKFSPGGAWIYWKPLPRAAIYPFADGGLTNAPLNMWDVNGLEVLMVPVKYKGLGRESIDLLALAANGGVLMGRTHVNIEVYQISTLPSFGRYLPYCLALNIWNFELGCLIPMMLSGPSFGSPASTPPPFAGAGFPMAGVTMLLNSGEGIGPRIAVTDSKNVKAMYTFSPETGFTRIFHLSTPDLNYTTTGTRVSSGVLTGTLQGRLTRTGSNLLEQPAQASLGTLTATPTLTKESNWLVMSREGTLTRLATSGRVSVTPGGESIASAAASCTHVFVSTKAGFFTYDANTLQQVAAVPTTGTGGLSSPVIGLKGEVYVVMGQYLFAFKSPEGTPSDSGCSGIIF
ncbi:MAG TPA: hypothetical protein VES20_23395, partial [Bryobacteraceae bacterium]|nr:hypothetical protein [Bryobacteraceae bacterium]